MELKISLCFSIFLLFLIPIGIFEIIAERTYVLGRLKKGREAVTVGYVRIAFSLFLLTLTLIAYLASPNYDF